MRIPLTTTQADHRRRGIEREAGGLRFGLDRDSDCPSGAACIGQLGCYATLGQCGLID
jgi:hypothetical protein